MRNTHLAAVDIGGTKVTVSIVHYDGILTKLYQRVKLEGDNTSIPEQVDVLIERACRRIGIHKKDISAVGISTCSPFKIKNGYKVIVSPNLCGGLAKERGVIPNDWTEIPLEEVLTGKYPRVKTGNDCVTSVVAERLFGAGKGEDNLVYVTWSTGIGTGIFVDGHLLKGKNENAAHGGHIYIAEDGPQCGCGNFGDLEALVSGSAIARDYGEGATTEDVFSAYRQGDTKAEKIIKKAAYNFARGMASINALMDTQLFIIGGSVFLNNRDILLPLVEQEFFKSFPALTSGVKFTPSALHTFLGDIAALSLVMPDEWVEKWEHDRPWENAPPAVVLEDNGNE